MKAGQSANFWKMVLAGAILIAGLGYWLVAGPVVMPIVMVVVGAAWLLVNIIRYARAT